MKFENCTLNQFKKAKFDEDYSEITKEELEQIYVSYIDLAEMYDIGKFNRIAYINFLRKRMFVIETAVNLHKNYLEEIGVAYEDGFALFRKYGYILTWKHPEDFIEQLNKVLIKEKKYGSILKKEIKELEEMASPKKEDTVLTRKSFMTTVLILGKNGYKIDNNSTTMEELALTILQEKEYFKSN